MSTVLRSAALCLLAVAVASSQQLEATIRLPDTLGGTVNLIGGFAAESDGRVYLYGGGGGYVTVLDGATSQRVARLRTGMGNNTACLDPVHGRIYATNFYNGTVTSTDVTSGEARTIAVGSFGPLYRPMAVNPGAGRLYIGTFSPRAVIVVATGADTIVSSIPLPSNPRSFAVDPAGARVCCQSDDGSITEFTAAGDSVLRTIALRGWGENLCFNAAGNRLYAIHADTLACIDAATGAVLSDFRDWVSADNICYNSVDDKLYVAGGTDGRVFILPGTADTILARPSFGPRPRNVGYCAARNEVYASDWHTSDVAVIDGAADTITTRVPAGPGAVFIFDPANGRNYCLSGNLAVVVDAETHAVLDRVMVGESPTEAELSSAHGLIGVLSSGRLLTIDCSNNELQRTLPMPGYVSDIVYDQTHDWYYAIDGYYQGGAVSYVTGTGDSVLRTIPVDTLQSFLYSPVSDKFYVGRGANHVAVYAAASGSLLAELPTAFGPYHLACDSMDNKLYCAGVESDSITVIDGASDTIIRTLTTGHWYGGLIYVPGVNKLYCTGQESRDVTIIDCANDSMRGYVLLPDCPDASYFHRPTNTLWFAVSSGVDDRLIILDCATDSVIDEVVMTATPWVLAGTDDGTHVYCGTSGSDGVTVLDAVTRSVVVTIPTDGRPYDFCWDSNHARMYATSPYGSCVVAVCDTTHVGVAGTETAPLRRTLPTIVRRVLDLPSAICSLQSDINLLDVSGRMVASLRPGPNDLSRLPPGVYFMRPTAGVERQESNVTKVVLTR
jgi:YVTN family beta-propeller protein